jgi:UDP-N-acetylmuramyl tripeptide synthase
MKKFFIVLGLIFLALIVLGGIGIAFVAIRGNALDKESKAYADLALPAIINTWSEKELLDRASPEFKKIAPIDQLDRLFRALNGLGKLQKCEPLQGQALMSATTQTGKMTTALYIAKATFQKGEATIKLGLIKHGDQWQILSFYVTSPAFLPP